MKTQPDRWFDEYLQPFDRNGQEIEIDETCFYIFGKFHIYFNFNSLINKLIRSI